MPTKNFQKNLLSNSGVTLIETLVGLMVLTIGIGGAAALATSSFASANHTVQQLVATGLAREGQEAVRAMRDTNWLKITSLDTNCYNFDTGGTTASCYRGWQNASGAGSGIYDINPAASGDEYVLDFVPAGTGGKYWDLRKVTGSSATDRFRVYNQTGANTSLYTQTSNSTPSTFYRKISLVEEATTFPYNQDTGPRLRVTSQVWWTGKGCPTSADWPGVGRCGIEFVSFLTNWKNY